MRNDKLLLHKYRLQLIKGIVQLCFSKWLKCIIGELCLNKSYWKYTKHTTGTASWVMWLPCIVLTAPAPFNSKSIVMTFFPVPVTFFSFLILRHPSRNAPCGAFQSPDWFTAGHGKVRVKINEETAMLRDREKVNKRMRCTTRDFSNAFFRREVFWMFYFSTWILSETVQDMGMRMEMEEWKKKKELNIMEKESENEKKCEREAEREENTYHCTVLREAKLQIKWRYRFYWKHLSCEAKDIIGNGWNSACAHIKFYTLDLERTSQNERNSKLISCKCYLWIIIHISRFGARQG